MKNKLRSLLLAGFLPFFVHGIAQSPLNVEFVSNIRYDFNLNDIWGYVDENGVEYAIVGTTHGVSIVSLQNPSSPTEVAWIDGPISSWRDMKTFENYLYISNETSDGLQIVDLSDLPNSVMTKDTVLARAETIHNLWIDEEGFLYLAGLDREVSNGGMVICDLNQDPWRPRVAGFYDDTYVHDVYVRNGFAYTAEIFNRRLRIVDVTDKANPESLGARTYDRAFTHNTWLNDAGKVCFTTDERSDVYVRSWDVTDPFNIVALDSIRSSVSDGEAIPHNVHVLNDFLITSYYSDGIHITDASDPTYLVEVGYFDTSPISGATFGGAWGAYPFLPSGLILGSDIGEGLFVLEPDYVRAGFVEGIITDALSGQAIDGAVLTFKSTNTIETSNSSGAYKYGTPGSTSISFTVEKLGYLPQTLEVDLTEGQSLVKNIEMMPARTFDLKVEVIDEQLNVPISDAQIALWAPGEAQPFSLVSDNVGIANELNFFEGNYEVRVGKWGFRQVCQQVSVSPESATLTILLQQGYSDDFSFDLGWQVGGTTSNGAFERGAPQQTIRFGIPINPGGDVDVDKGDFAYVTGLQSESYFDNILEGGTSTLISPMMDLTRIENPILSYDWWLVNYEDDTNGRSGSGSLETFIDNGDTLVQIARYDRAFNGDRWNEEEVNLEEIIPITPTMRLVVVASNTSFPSLLEAGFDDFNIKGISTTSIAHSPDRISLKIYPNPSSGYLNVQVSQRETPAEPFEIQLMDLAGRKVMTHSSTNSQGTSLDLSRIPKGIYLVNIVQNGTIREREKLILR